MLKINHTNIPCVGVYFNINGIKCAPGPRQYLLSLQLNACSNRMNYH